MTTSASRSDGSGKREGRELSFSLYLSVYLAAQHLTKRQQGAYMRALADYFFRGIEPADLPRDAANVFSGVRYRVERARGRAIASGKLPPDGVFNEPARDVYATGAEPVRDEYAQSTEPVREPVRDGGFVDVSAETAAAHADVHEDVPPRGWGRGWGLGTGEDVSSPVSVLSPTRVDTNAPDSEDELFNLFCAATERGGECRG